MTVSVDRTVTGSLAKFGSRVDKVETVPITATNPFNGRPLPSFDEAVASARRSVSQLAAPDLQTPWSWQGSIGLQRQLGGTASAEADYVMVASRN